MPEKFEPVGLYSGKALKNWESEVLSFFRLWGPLVLISGLSGGIGAVLFKYLIELNQDFFFGYLLVHGVPIVFLPVLGGLIVGPVIYKWASEAWGHGVPEVMEALRSRGGKIRSRVAFVKIVASSVTIGSGGSAGREGPIGQIGAALSSIIGQWLHLDERSLRLMVMAGASAGISGTFKAPIGGALFGLEVLNSEIRTSDLLVMVFSSIIGYVVSMALLGPSAIFIAQNVVYDYRDIPFYFILGVIGGFAAYLWTRTLYGVEDTFAKVKMQRQWFSPSIGAMGVGLIGLAMPETLGLGYTFINQFFAGNLQALLATFAGSIVLVFLVLFLAKLGTSALTIGSGGSGGVFSPSLFMGAMLGAMFGVLVMHLVPSVAPNYYSFALVGMGVVFAGAAKAPLMSTIIVAEMSHNYTILPGLLIACVTAYLVSGPGSIYMFKVQRTVGQNIPDKYLSTPQMPALALLAYRAIKSSHGTARKRDEKKKYIKIRELETHKFFGRKK